MGTAANQRVAPGRVLLILVLLLAVWLGFEFYPRKKPASPMVPVQAESKLRSLGLADNPDWEGLPQFFAVWAEKIEWNDNKAHFAYWHPGSRSYAYFFEVARQGKGYLFREVSPQWLADEGYGAEDDASPLQIARLDSEAPTHPFVFLDRLEAVPPGHSVSVITDNPPGLAKPLVPVDLKPVPLNVPPPNKVKTP